MPDKMKLRLLLLPLLPILFAFFCVSCDTKGDSSYVQKMEFDQCVCSYYNEEDGKVTATLFLVDGNADSEGVGVAPFEGLFFEIFFPVSETAGRTIAAGRYIGSDSMEPFTYTNGDLFAAHYSVRRIGEQELVYPVESGEVNVSTAGNGCEISVNVKLNDQWRVRGTFKGSVTFLHGGGDNK